jgi:hypothetical protein
VTDQPKIGIRWLIPVAVGLVAVGSAIGPVSAAVPRAASPFAVRTNLYSVSCPTTTECTVVGSMLIGGARQPLHAAESKGVWGQATADPVAPGGELLSVSCPSAGNCTAVGDEGDLSGSWPIYAMESSGVWGPVTEIAEPVPFGGSFDSVSCTSSTDCTAVGQADARNAFPIFATESDGIWGEAENGPTIPLPGGFSSISCSSPGTCTAVGSYGKAFTANLSAGSWSPSTELPTPSHSWAALNAISCVDARPTARPLE